MPRSALLALVFCLLLLLASGLMFLRASEPSDAPGPQGVEESASEESPRPAKEGRSHRFESTPSTAKLSGDVLTAEGAPAEGALVVLERLPDDPRRAPEVLRTQLVREDGAFHFEVPPGAYTLHASLDALASDRSPPLVLAPGAVSSPVRLVLEPGASLVLTVRDAADGSSLDKCRVDGLGRNLVALCDHAGRIRLAPLAPGPLGLRVSAPGYAPVETELVLTRRARLSTELSLQRGARVQGRVLAPEGRPVAGATVRATHYVLGGSLPAEVSTRSDATGSFLLEGIAPGRVTLRASSSGWAEAASPELKLLGTESLEGIELVLTTGGAIAGEVHRAGGGAVSGATIEAVRLVDGRKMSGDLSALDGSFRIDGLEPGLYTVSASSGPMRALARGLEVSARDETLVTLILGSDSVQGRVVDPSGHPVPGAWVSGLSQLSSGLGEISTRSDAGGLFSLGGLSGAPYRVQARSEGLGVAEARGVEPGAELTLRLGGTGRLEGSVVSDGGGGLEAFELVVSPLDGDENGTGGRFRVLKLLSPDGTFVIDALPVGRYEVRARSSGHLDALTQSEVQAGRSAHVTLRLSTGARASGRVLRGDTPASGCLVMGRVPTGADGSFEIDTLPARPFFLWARCGNEEAAGLRVDLTGGQASGLELVLRPMPGHLQESEADFGGIGASLRSLRDGRIVVAGVYEATPAFFAGIRSGDELLSVDGWAASGQPVTAVVEKIRGPLGTPVSLELSREGRLFRAVAERARIALN